MVLVLAVSLTTATYAWFTVASVTTLETFDVKVVANNAVNIGVKIDNKLTAGATADAFLNGQVNYSPAAEGTVGLGTWADGTPGLGATIDHNIKWGEQQKAVGLSTITDKAQLTTSNVGTWDNGGTTVWAANGVAQTSIDTNSATKAVANINGEKNGDYAYLVLGVAPTRTLTSNELVIMIDGSKSEGTIVGILSAVHVAYRTLKAGETTATPWVDVDLFGEDETTGNHYDDLLAEVSGLDADYTQAYKDSYGVDAPTSGVAYHAIELGIEQGKIDQVEIVIYIAGADSDCRLEALGASGSISIFFATTEPAPAPEQGN
jgi:hypothetical protein